MLQFNVIFSKPKFSKTPIHSYQTKHNFAYHHAAYKFGVVKFKYCGKSLIYCTIETSGLGTNNLTMGHSLFIFTRGYI